MFFEVLKMAFSALTANKTRTALSMLGVVIGVSTVIAVVGIGVGAQEQVEEQYKNLNANSLIIFGSMGRDAIGSSKLDADDVDLILQAETVTKAAASVSGNAEISSNDLTESKSVIGGTEEILEISNLETEFGRGFTTEENEDRAKVAVLGHQAALDFFGDDVDLASLLGQLITIGSRKFEIIGILAENGGGMMGMSPDDSIYIPQQTAEKTVLGDNARLMINVQAESADLIDVTTIELTALLREAHKIREGREDDFRIRDAGSMVSAATDSAAMMTALLTSVAAVVLLVSGIGIMNVMFVTVTERTREIGVIKAIGGRRIDILTQFLLESVILSLAGGLLGIAIGLGAIPLLNTMEDWYVVPSTSGAILGFVFSALVGIFFGFYPALRASSLDPVDALRSE